MQPFPKKFSGLLKIYLSKFKLQIFIALLLTILGILFENLNIRFFANIIGALKENDENSYNEAFKYVYLLIGSSLGFIVFTNYSRYFFKKKFTICCCAICRTVHSISIITYTVFLPRQPTC